MVGGDTLYNVYKAWCKHDLHTAMSGTMCIILRHRDEKSYTMFGREMGKRYEKTRPGGRIVYRGIGLLTPDEVETIPIVVYKEAFSRRTL